MRLPRKLVGKERRPKFCLFAAKLYDKKSGGVSTQYWCEVNSRYITWHDCRSCTKGRARR